MHIVNSDSRQQLREWRRDVRPIEDLYIQNYSFRDPRQIDGEKEWLNLHATVDVHTGDLPAIAEFRSLYKGHVESLLWCNAEKSWKESKDALATQLLAERKAMVLDISSSITAVDEVLERFQEGMQKTLWQRTMLRTRRLHDSDIPQVKYLEATLYENPWIGKTFAEFFERQARSARLYDRYGKQSPMVGIVAGDAQHQRMVDGYVVAHAMNGERTYQTMRGTIVQNRRSLQVLTHGAREEHASEASELLVHDLLKAAKALVCTRIEDLFETHHKA